MTAGMVASSSLARCQAPDCLRYFVKTHGRQLYCPNRPATRGRETCAATGIDSGEKRQRDHGDVRHLQHLARGWTAADAPDQIASTPSMTGCLYLPDGVA
jgi:hypothetical protein